MSASLLTEGAQKVEITHGAFKFSNMHGRCEICGLSRNRRDHTECALIKQRMKREQMNEK